MARVVQAQAFGGPEVLTVVEVPVPEPGPGEVAVSVHAAAVNRMDVKVYSGAMGADPAQLPMRLGFEAAGLVTAVGEDARGPQGEVAVGDEVIVFRTQGAYATELVVPATAVVPKPSTLGWEPAAGLMLTGVTAVHVLTHTEVGDGDTVLVHGGSGGVGLMTVQLARERGARVVATASAARHDLLRSLGAEPVAYGDGLLERVREIAPDGIDVAIDLVGSDEALEVSLALVEDRSRIVTIANFASAPAAGVKVLGGRGPDSGEAIRDAARPDLARLAGEGTLQVLVARTFPLDEVTDAHRLAAEGHTTGKIVLVP